VSDEQSTSPFLPRFHIFSHKLKLKLVKKLHLEIRGGSSEPPRPPLATGLQSTRFINIRKMAPPVLRGFIGP